MGEDFPLISSEDIPRAAEAEAHETYLPDQELLHGASSLIDPNHPLIPKAQALRQHCINGNVVAVIELPQGDDEPKPKQIAIVDYGDIKPGETVPTMVVDGHDVGHITGYAKTRFGIKAYNYTP